MSPATIAEPRECWLFSFRFTQHAERLLSRIMAKNCALGADLLTRNDDNDAGIARAAQPNESLSAHWTMSFGKLTGVGACFIVCVARCRPEVS